MTKRERKTIRNNIKAEQVDIHFMFIFIFVDVIVAAATEVVVVVCGCLLYVRIVA